MTLRAKLSKGNGVLQHFLGTVGNAEAIKNAGEKGSDENLKSKQLLFSHNYIGLDSSKAIRLMRIITAQKMAWYSEEMSNESQV